MIADGARTNSCEFQNESWISGSRCVVLVPSKSSKTHEIPQVQWLVDGLKKFDLDSELLSLSQPVPNALSWVKDVPLLATLAQRTVFLGRLARKLWSARAAHVVLTSELSIFSGLASAVILTKVFRRRLILHSIETEPSYPFGGERDTVLRLLLGMADRVVVPTKKAVEACEESGLDAKRIVNFVPAHSPSPGSRRTSKPTIVMNADVATESELQCLLRAFGRIQQCHSDGVLVLIGGEKSRCEVANFAERFDIADITYLDRLDSDESQRMLADADIYLNASPIYGQWHAIVACLAQGVPVVTVQRSGVSEVIEDELNGLIVEDTEGADASLADAAHRLLAGRDLHRELKQNAKTTYDQRYSWEAVGERWKSLYMQLLSRPLQVCLVAPSTRTGIGGQAIQAERLRDRLRQASNIDSFFVFVNPRLPKGLRWLQRVKYIRTFVTELWYLTLLVFHVRRADVMHIFAASYLSFVLAPTPAVVLGRVLGKGTVLNYHSGEAGDHLQGWGDTAIPTIRLTDSLVVPSEYLVEIFERFNLHARQIPNFVELDRFTFRHRTHLRPVFLSNRNLEPHYDVETLLRAFAYIQGRHPNARLYVAGDGSQRSYLEELRSDLGLHRVDFLGEVPVSRMPDLLDEADVYLNSSVIDNMPMSIIEAFASGLPVVTTSAGGISYLVDHEETGLLVTPQDEEALAHQAVRLLQKPRLAAYLSENARAECEQRYTWNSVGQQWIHLYWRLCRDSMSKQGRGGDREETVADRRMDVASKPKREQISATGKDR